MLIPGDDVPGAPLTVVLNHSYWSRRFGQDSNIVGSAVTINGVAGTIVGVEPPGLDSISRVGRPSPEVSVPISTEAVLRPDFPLSTQPIGWWLMVMGRLRPGSTIDEARMSVEPAFRQAVGDAWDSARPPAPGAALPANGIPRLALTPGNRGVYDVSTDDVTPLILLAAVFGIVLLIVGINVANLVLSRTENRQAEISVRMAIGAGRRRLVRQLLTESIVLAMCGGAAGLAVAYLVFYLFGFAVSTPTDTVHWRTLGFAGGLAFLTGVIFGFVPALRVTRMAAARPSSAGHRSSRARSRLGESLVVAQIALSLVLLVGAGLFLKTLVNVPGRRHRLQVGRPGAVHDRSTLRGSRRGRSNRSVRADPAEAQYNTRRSLCVIRDTDASIRSRIMVAYCCRRLGFHEENRDAFGPSVVFRHDGDSPTARSRDYHGRHAW